MSDALEKKIERAIKLIQSAGRKASENGQPLEICYSGGKDSDVILELAKMAGVEYRAIYKNTTIDPPYTIKHVKEKNVEIMRPKRTFFQLIEQKGFPDRWRRFCCGELKEYKVLDYAVVGVRREESRARRDRYQEPEKCRVYTGGEKARQYFPILEWTASDVSEFIESRHIKCHPLYYDEQGKFHAERRLGCMCCPLLSKKRRIALFMERPRMLRLWLNAGRKFYETHPNSKIVKMTNGNIYDLMTMTLFSGGEREFKERFGETMFGNDAIDTKSYLENYFKIEL